MKLHWILLFVVSLVVGDDLDEFDRMMAEPSDRSRWIDPHNMGQYNPNSKDCTDTEAKLKVTREELSNCRDKLERINEESCPSTVTTTKPTTRPTISSEYTSNDVFLKRHVSHLISKLGLNTNPISEHHLKLEVLLTAYQVKTLQNFISSSKSNVPATDVDQILSTFIKNVDTYENSPWLDTIKERLTYLRDPLIVIILMLCLVYVISLMVRSISLFRVVLIISLSCICWHWFRMYKAAWALKHSKLLQSTNVPPECRPEEMTWLQTFETSGRSMFTSVDRCDEYHKAIHVDPIYEVNPLMAVVDLLTNLFFHPLASLGPSIGAMFSGLLEAVPTVWKVPVLILFVLLIMFVMILMSGYQIRLPLFLGEIGPAPANPSVSGASKEIQELKELLLQYQMQNLTLTDRKMSAPVTRLEYDRQNSGVEELLPIESEEQSTERLHVGTPRKNVVLESEDVRPKEVMREQLYIGTPRKNNLTKKSGVPLTPVKASVLIKPEILSSRKPEDMKTNGDLLASPPCEVLDLTSKKRSSQDGDAENLPQTPTRKAVDLSSKNSQDGDTDNLPQTPTRKLIVEGFNGGSPRGTKFKWTSSEADSLDFLDDAVEIVEDDESSNFLDKVETVFFKPNEEE